MAAGNAATVSATTTSVSRAEPHARNVLPCERRSRAPAREFRTGTETIPYPPRDTAAAFSGDWRGTLFRFPKESKCRRSRLKHLAIAASLVAHAGCVLGGARGRHAGRQVHNDDQEPAQFKGTWVLKLAKGGTYTVDNGQLPSAADTRRPDRGSPSATRPATAPAPSPAPTPGRRPAGRSGSPA